MRNPDLFLADAHTPPSEVSFQDGEPTRPLTECSVLCARAGRRPKLFQRQAGCPERSRGRPSGAFVGTLGGQHQPPDPLVGIRPHPEAGRTVPKFVWRLLRHHKQLWRPIPGLTKILGRSGLWLSEVHDVSLGLRKPYSDHPFPLPYQCLYEYSGAMPKFDLETNALNMLPVASSNDARHWPV